MRNRPESEFVIFGAGERLIRSMDIEVIENIGINNLHPVFGMGLRGETLAASRNRRFVNDLVSAGVRGAWPGISSFSD